MTGKFAEAIHNDGTFPDLAGHFDRPVRVAWRAYRPGEVPSSHVEDLRAVAGAGALRQADFLHGRAAAREALAALGCSETFVARGEGGAPIWPDGFVGSISHCEGLCVAVVARTMDVASIGIDIERVDRVHPHLWPEFCTESELASMKEPARCTQSLGAITFGAKEAFFKLQWPDTRVWLGFKEAEVDILHSQFWLMPTRVVPKLRSGIFEGRYTMWKGHVIATLFVEAASQCPSIKLPDLA